MRKKTKILIAVPVHSYIECATIKSIYDLEIPKNVEADFDYSLGYTVGIARNNLTQTSLSGNYDYTLWVDGDVVLPKDYLVRMLKIMKDKKDAGLVTGYYIKKTLEDKITELYGFTADGKDVQNIKESVLPKEGIYEIQGCGLGVSLVDNKALKHIKDKYGLAFEYIIRTNDLISEDLDFCNKLKAEGYKLYADVSAKVPHIGKLIYS